MRHSAKRTPANVSTNSVKRKEENAKLQTRLRRARCNARTLYQDGDSSRIRRHKTELGVTKETILKGLRTKITGLKNKYWKSLFNHLSEVTKRLATKQRKAFLDSLNGKAVIDFTEPNIQSMLIWIAKWSSDHFDDQLVELFKSLAQKSNVERFKSNEKVFTYGNWRYLKEGESHYKLCYRLVVEGFGGINNSEYSYNATNNLTNTAHEFISDIVTIANNLGFGCSDKSVNYKWRSGKKIEFHLDNGSILMDVKAHKNGNLHIRVAKDVMLAINVQVGKLLGWVNSAEEAMNELGATKKEAELVRRTFALTNEIVPSNLLRISHAA